MRSVSVVLPESMWALMPMFRIFEMSTMLMPLPAAAIQRVPVTCLLGG
jgi:hypothetical protein